MNIESKIKQDFVNKQAVRLNTFNRYIELNKEIKIYLENILISIPEWESIYNVFKGILFNLKLKRCKTCGKLISFSKINNTYCSTKCLNIDPEIKDKIKNTNIEKYGVDNPAKNIKIQTKIKETNIKKYGVDNPAKAKEVQDKTKQTNKIKYGTNYTFQSDEIKNKIKLTKTIKYKDSHYTNTAKQSKTVITKSYYNFFTEEKFKLIKPLFSLQEYEGVGYYKTYKWLCLKCNNSFEDHCYSHIPVCPICFPLKHGRSNMELEIFNFLLSLNIKANLYDNTIIYPKELDLTIPEKNLAIEFNGLYWHSKKEINYHMNKTELCEEKGYKLIHIWEQDWINKQNIIKHNIKQIFNCNNTTEFTAIKEINDNDKNHFLTQNSLYDIADSDLNIGLLYNDILIQLITFKNIVGKSWQILSNTNKIYHNIPHGTKIILDYFIKRRNPSTLICSTDRNFSQEIDYINCGFNIIDKTTPNKKLIKDPYSNNRSYIIYDSGNLIMKKELG